MRELSLHVLDIAENSVRAGAENIRIGVDVDEAGDWLTVSVSDDGSGMPEGMAEDAADPFVTTRTERKVGLGLPLLAAACERTGGKLTIESHPGRGTRVCAEFGLTNIDRAPIGDLVSTMVNLSVGYPDQNVGLQICSPRGEFQFDSGSVRGELDDVSLSNPEVVKWMREYLAEGIGRVLNLE